MEGLRFIAALLLLTPAACDARPPEGVFGCTFDAECPLKQRCYGGVCHRFRPAEVDSAANDGDEITTTAMDGGSDRGMQTNAMRSTPTRTNASDAGRSERTTTESSTSMDSGPSAPDPGAESGSASGAAAAPAVAGSPAPAGAAGSAPDAGTSGSRADGGASGSPAPAPCTPDACKPYGSCTPAAPRPMCQCDGPPSQNGLTCPYLDGKDGTIYDATSGLTWQTVAMHTAVENGAVDGVRQLQLQCDGVALPGSFWRVPTRNELLTTIVTLFPIQLEPGCLAFSAPDNAAAMFMCGDLQTATYLRCVH